MTLSEGIESLRVVNRKLAATVGHWQSSNPAAGATCAQDLSALRQEILGTANCLRAMPRDSEPNAELAREISQYRSSLEQLARFLPLVRLGLEARKKRLEAAVHHLTGVAAWIDASSKSL